MKQEIRADMKLYLNYATSLCVYISYRYLVVNCVIVSLQDCSCFLSVFVASSFIHTP